MTEGIHNMPIGSFANKKPAASASAKPAKKGRFAGVKSEADKTPMFQLGTYRIRIVSVEEGFNPGTQRGSCKVNAEVVECAGDNAADADKPGDVRFMNFSLSTLGGQSAMKAWIVATSGYDNDDDYDAFDADGFFIESVLGETNGWEERGTLIGRLVDVQVVRGGAVKDENGRPSGDFYRNFLWAVVPDEEQTVPRAA